MSRNSSTLSLHLLKAVIRSSGLTLEEVARKAGIHLGTMRSVHSGWRVTPRMRRRIEVALGRAVWTSKAEFFRQQQLVQWLAFDPFILNLKETRIHGAAKGIPAGGRNPSRSLITARLFAAFDAAHPAPAVAPRRKRAASMISTAGTPPTEKTTNPQ